MMVLVCSWERKSIFGDNIGEDGQFVSGRYPRGTKSDTNEWKVC